MEILNYNMIESGGRKYRHYEVRIKADSPLSALALTVPHLDGTLERVYYILNINGWYYVRVYTVE